MLFCVRFGFARTRINRRDSAQLSDAGMRWAQAMLGDPNSPMQLTIGENDLNAAASSRQARVSPFQLETLDPNFKP